MLHTDILNECSTKYRKVARVFGRVYETYRENKNFNYDVFEQEFFYKLHELIQSGVIESQGTIRADNMGFSEIVLTGAKTE